MRPRQSAGRGLCRGVRHLFLRALVVENDAGENVHRQGEMDLVENGEKKFGSRLSLTGVPNGRRPTRIISTLKTMTLL